MKRRARIVPSLVVTASFVGVIPAKEEFILGVAAVAMCCFDSGDEGG